MPPLPARNPTKTRRKLLGPGNQGQPLALRCGVDRCRALRDKYLTLHALRLAKAQSGEVAPREQLRALAQRFPGALRELDRLPLERIEARIGELDAALAGTRPAPDWVPLQLAYHGWLKLALAVRAGGPGESTPQARARLHAEYRPGPGEPDPGRLEEAELEAIRRPPGGRINHWVYARVALDQGGDWQAVESALFGHPAASHPARRCHSE